MTATGTGRRSHREPPLRRIIRELPIIIGLIVGVMFTLSLRLTSLENFENPMIFQSQSDFQSPPKILVKKIQKGETSGIRESIDTDNQALWITAGDSNSRAEKREQLPKQQLLVSRSNQRVVEWQQRSTTSPNDNPNGNITSSKMHPASISRNENLTLTITTTENRIMATHTSNPTQHNRSHKDVRYHIPWETIRQQMDQGNWTAGQFMLDFAILGFPKCGTSTMSKKEGTPDRISKIEYRISCIVQPACLFSNRPCSHLPVFTTSTDTRSALAGLPS
jgi:hypothetical protein